LTITNGASLVTQLGRNIVTVAGDTCIIRATAANTVELLDYAPVTPDKQIQSITASVGSSALTATLNPSRLDFRSSTLTSGTVNTRYVASAISVTAPNGATLGTSNGVASKLAVLAIDNAGTLELAAVNIAGGNDLSETGLISTTAEGGVGAADSASVIYSTTSRTNVPYRVVGFIESTQATAGTWASAPSLIQGKGGQAINAMSSLGYGQTWQAVTRNSGTTYYNNTGKPILLQVTGAGVSGVGQVAINIQGVAMNVVVTSAGVSYTGLILIPDGAYYTLTDTNIASRTTFELR